MIAIHLCTCSCRNQISRAETVNSTSWVQMLNSKKCSKLGYACSSRISVGGLNSSQKSPYFRLSAKYFKPLFVNVPGPQSVVYLCCIPSHLIFRFHSLSTLLPPSSSLSKYIQQNPHSFFPSSQLLTRGCWHWCCAAGLRSAVKASLLLYTTAAFHTVVCFSLSCMIYNQNVALKRCQWQSDKWTSELLAS